MSAYVVRVWNRDDDQAERMFGPFRSRPAAERLEARIEKRLPALSDFAVEIMPVTPPVRVLEDLAADGWFDTD